MPQTRRNFFETTAGLGAGLTGLASFLPQASAQSTGPMAPDLNLQIPKIKFGNVEISRVVLGVNPFYGFAHYNNNLSAAHEGVVHRRPRLRASCTSATGSASTPSTTSTRTAGRRIGRASSPKAARCTSIIQVDRRRG